MRVSPVGTARFSHRRFQRWAGHNFKIEPLQKLFRNRTFDFAVVQNDRIPVKPAAERRR